MKLRTTTLALTLLLLLACGGTEDRSRVFILGLDGFDPQAADLLMSEGKLPNLAKLRQEGAYGLLRTEKPILSPIIWTTIATGKGPEEHGIGHFVAVRGDTGEPLPVTSRMRRVKALWNIASEAGRRVLTVGWWATWPPEEVNGSVVSDHTAYHFLFEDGFTGGKAGESKTYPPELMERIAPMLVRPGDLGPADLAPFVDVPAEELKRPFDFEDDLSHFRWALATAMSYRKIGLDLWRSERPDLAMLYIEATDSTSHLFGHLFREHGLKGELASQQARYGHAVEQMYLYADGLIGDVLEAMDERTTLLIASDHGFELGVLHDDPSKTRDLRRVSERFHREEGVLYLYGNQVKRHSRIEQPTIRDVAPTVLALLGLPAARDMKGRVLEEAFSRDAPARRWVKTRVATYEGEGGGPARPDLEPETGDEAVAAAQLEHLKSLGYLGGDEPMSSPQGDRNLAAIQFENGNYRQAAEMYRALVEADPEDAALRTSLAGALGALGRYAEARRELEKAIELEPLNVEAYHNRAVIYEREGRPDLAVADYERALRYQPQYEPSQRALYRLTGHTNVREPHDKAEAEAAALAEEASLAARRGDYQKALRLLDEAEKRAPKFILTYQYRSNVAYLMGDRAAAIAALEKALELEPDNALFRQNLARLREEASKRPGEP